MRDLTDADVARVDPARLAAEVTRCLADLGRGEAVQAPKSMLPLTGTGFFLSLSAVVPRLGLGAAKWASYAPGAAGEPGVSTAVVLASDAATGEPRARITGMLATHTRTAAAAVAAAWAARPGRSPHRVVLIGYGPTNRAVRAAVRAAWPHADVTILVRSAASASAILGATTDPAVLRGADVAFSATGATAPVATVDDLAPDGVAVSLDGVRTWRHDPDRVLRDHGDAPAVPRLVAGLTAAPDGRVLLDVAGCAVTDVALAALLLGVTR